MKRARNFLLPPIALDRRSHDPLHRQIYRQIAVAIRSGAMAQGGRLPSTRLLARLLAVSRNTVLAAYDDLAADELILGERGAGMRINGKAQAGGLRAFGLQQAIREAYYPARTIPLADPDGNPVYINY